MASTKSAGDYLVETVGFIGGGIDSLTGVTQGQTSLAMQQVQAEKDAIVAESQSTLISYGLIAIGVFSAAILGAAYLFRR